MTGRLPSAGLDSSLDLWRDPYGFISSTCDRLGDDGFSTRVMLRRAVCLRGPEAMALVYGSEGLTRQGAMPGWVLRLLQDRGSVQQLDGADHRRRKALFLRLLVESDADTDLVSRFRAAWQARAEQEGRIEVLKDASAMLAACACDWSGLDDLAGEPAVSEALFEMSDRAGRPGPAAWAALRRRRVVERRIARAVRERRAAGFAMNERDTPLARLSLYDDGQGQLSAEVVAVEFLNLLRPITAVGRFIAFAARELVLRPDLCRRIAEEPALAIRFAEEIRRWAPFFPFTAAVATRPVRWRNVTLPKGCLILADLYGTCHDPALFPEPDEVRPERGLDWRDPAPGFVPQGAGDPAQSHRCPGEKVTVALIAEATRLLAEGGWTAPEQDLGLRGRPPPAQPVSGVLLDYRVRKST